MVLVNLSKSLNKRTEWSGEKCFHSLLDLFKILTYIIFILTVFGWTIYLTFRDYSRGSDNCRVQVNPPKFNQEVEDTKLVTWDLHTRVSFKGYLEFERSFLIENNLKPLYVDRRILSMEPRSIQRESSDFTTNKDKLTIITGCGPLILQFHRITDEKTNQTSYQLEDFHLSLAVSLTGMNWYCQLKGFNVKVTENIQYANERTLIYPCFRPKNLEKGSDKKAASLHIEKLTIKIISD